MNQEWKHKPQDRNVQFNFWPKNLCVLLSWNPHPIQYALEPSSPGVLSFLGFRSRQITNCLFRTPTALSYVPCCVAQRWRRRAASRWPRSGGSPDWALQPRFARGWMVLPLPLHPASCPPSGPSGTPGSRLGLLQEVTDLFVILPLQSNVLPYFLAVWRSYTAVP